MPSGVSGAGRRRSPCSDRSVIASDPPVIVSQAAPATVAGLSPVLDRPYRIITSQQHRIGETVRRFTTERRVVFRREPGGGLNAEMVLLAVSTDLPGAGAQRFAIAAGALRDRLVRVHLAPDGTVTAIDDEERLRAAMAAGVATLTANAPSPPPPIDRAALAAPLMAVLAGPGDRPPAGSRAVSLPANTPDGSALTGTETATTVAGRLRVVTHAAGTVGVTTIVIDRERVIDLATGLVLRRHETQTTRIGERTLVITDETALASPVS